ncbi:GTP-binding protein 10 [Parasteatoda tepidariorum]|uniref:GTP-binding protein 10 n=1 Tax=Parasteatoda tepidariorum TaxID=114398 RepID=UPI001C720BC3|nr:GTP-binding protein 10 [Parasteatoda tepidariorum]
MVRLGNIFLRERQTFIDSVRISVRGGRGGNGLPKYGGVGGKGGDVYLEACESYSLAKLKRNNPTKKFIGGPGGDSKRFQILGSPGTDTMVKCPPGVSVYGNVFIGDINKIGDKVLLAKGGCGGGPQNGFLGQKGQAMPLTLDLKLLADVGFVGYPNAGKSTLLSALSNAHPKIASYPFTTIAPNIGILNFDDFRTISAADLPGLIEGAHMNYGMGHKFLKHCVRTKVLLFVVDIEGFRLNPLTSHRTPFETVMLLNRELELYDEELVLKPAILAVNKSDTDSDGKMFQELKEEMQCSEKLVKDLPDQLKPSTLVKFDSIIPISAKTGDNILNLKNKVRKIIDIYHEKKLIRYPEKILIDQNEQDVIYA